LEDVEEPLMPSMYRRRLLQFQLHGANQFRGKILIAEHQLTAVYPLDIIHKTTTMRYVRYLNRKHHSQKPNHAEKRKGGVAMQ
jgi:hypothetical protein